MSGREDLREAKFEETRSTLSEGLKACRAVLRNYRQLLADDSGGGHPRADNDHREADNER
ncbi:MAG: hypothetical protein ACJ8E3_01850 [Sphingomicrobium sp.]